MTVSLDRAHPVHRSAIRPGRACRGQGARRRCPFTFGMKQAVGQDPVIAELNPDMDAKGLGRREIRWQMRRGLLSTSVP